MTYQSKRSARAIAVVIACSFGLLSTSALAFDLGNSTSSYQAPPAVQDSGVAINVGGHVRVVTPGSNVTAAEYAAVQQVLTSGAQTLNLNDVGAAVAGRFSVNQIPASVLSSLAIPTNVTAIQDFAKSAGSLAVPGTLSNLGTFYAVSTSESVTNAMLGASNIYNGVNGLLTSVLPASGLSGYSDAITNLSLTLSAANGIVNRGIISSAADLNIVGANVNVDNAGGKLIANGAINIGNGGTTNVTVGGGDLLSSSVNVHANDALRMSVGDVAGLVNLHASSVVFSATAPTLRLGSVYAGGDPIITNNAGDILLSSANPMLVVTNADEQLNLVASGSILVDPSSPSPVTISTNGGDVLMSAGAAWTATDLQGNPIVTGASATGGKIDLTGAPGVATLTTNGGNIALTAYAGSDPGSGIIVLPTALDLNTKSSPTTGGAVSLNASSTIAAGKVTAGGAVTINAPDKITLNGAITTSGDLSMTTDWLVNITQLKANNITLASTPGHDLKVEGFIGDVENPTAASWNAAGTLTWVASPALTGISDNKLVLVENSHQSITATQSQLIANGLGEHAKILVEDNALIHTHQPITLYTQHLEQPEELLNGPEVGVDGSPVKLVSPTNKAVISSAGDLRIPSNIIAPGQNLAIVASGNITGAPGFSTIDLSNTKGQSGSALIIAGYHFTSVNDVFVVDSPSTSGGSVLLPNVSIKTTNGFSGPDNENVQGVGGNVTVVAHAGDNNSGAILLKDITTKATTFEAKGGRVLLIGQGGVKVGNIDTTAVHAGSVSIFGAEPQLLNGPLTIEKGNITSGSIFVANPVVVGQGAAVSTGKINTSTLFARAGNITIASDSSVTVGGDIVALGQRSLQHGTSATAGGVVTISSLTDNVTVKGSIDVSGMPKLGEIAADANGGANAGNITISSPSTILITGNVKAVGGTTIGVDHAGNGGKVTLTSTDVLGNSMRGGTVQINGYIDVHGANGKTTGTTNGREGDAGNGGTVTINAGQVVVKGKIGGYSIDARKGTTTRAGASAGLPGVVALDTYAVQSLPSNFNLLSNKSTEVALPGGKLTVGIATPLKGFSGVYNGVAGGIITDTTANALKTATFVQTTVSTTPGLTITVHGGAQDLTELQSQNFGFSFNSTTETYLPGTLVTPARAVALMQVSRGQTQGFAIDNTSGAALDVGASGSGPAIINVDQTQMRQSFSSFVLDTMNASGDIDLQVSGTRPTLDLSASTNTKIRGSVDFVSLNTVATVNFGSKLGTKTAPAVLPQGVIQTGSTGTIALGITGSSYRNAGTLSAGQLLFLNNAATFTLENFGHLNEVSGAVIINNEGVVPKLSFKSVGAGWNGNITGASAQLPLASGPAALRTLPITPARTIDLTVQIARPFSSPFGASLLPGTALLAGTLDADNVKVTTVATTGANKVLVPTNTIISSASSNTTNFTVNSSGNIFFQDTSVTANGGSIQIVAADNIAGSSAGSGNSFTANGVGTPAKPVGGGIAFIVGAKTPNTLPPLLKSSTPSGNVNGLGGSGAGAGTGDVLYDNQALPGHPSGVLAVTGQAPIDLTVSGFVDATIKQRGGAILFATPNSPTANNYIQFEGIHLETSGPSPFSPIAYTSSASAAMGLFEMADDASYETQFGTVHVKKNAIFAMEQSADGLRIKVFSGPADIRIESEDTSITLAPGEEIHLTHAANTVAPQDGIGRRNVRSVQLAPYAHARLAEFSIVSYLQNAKYISDLDRSSRTFHKMLKTAAALHTVARGKSEPYSTR